MTGAEIPRALNVPEAVQIGLIGKLRVFLDGDEIRRVFEYDQDAGTVTVHKFRDNGRPLMIAGRVAREVKSGIVRVVWK